LTLYSPFALESLHGIGIMSGTSHDGLDLAYCIFRHDDGRWSYDIINSKTIPYSETWKTCLLGLTEADKETIRSADQELGNYIGEAIRAFIDTHSLKVDFIASHGHTIFHDPSNKITLQIGAGEKIASLCGIVVINDFRSADVFLGGQGAPLVPLGDRLLFSEYDYCLNLGGIANISYEHLGQRIAFDICPANMVLNMLAEKVGMPFDDKGKMAESVTIIPSLLNELESLPFYSLQGPRSLGREWVLDNIFPKLEEYRDQNIMDLLACFTEHIALRIASVLSDNGKSMLVTGGGAYNEFLIKRMLHHSRVDIHIPDEIIIDYKEAMIFAFLGLLRLKGIDNVLGSVTGAGRDHCAGEITRP